ncbi:MAG: hypothetical protein KJZ86_13750 [Caldilineaceae bacterium]|nr:hypothetical protein [Caldilineaceae bacterium]HRJ42683.1 hypothetical protein [Caldilineaceae bacterium]
MTNLELIAKALAETKARQADLLGRQQTAENALPALKKALYAESLGGLGEADKAGKVDAEKVKALAESIQAKSFEIAALKEELRATGRQCAELESRHERLLSEARRLAAQMNAALLPALWLAVTGPESVEAEIGPMRQRYREIAGDVVV